MNGEMCTDDGRNNRERTLQLQRATRFQQISGKRDLIALSNHRTSRIKVSKSMMKLGDVNALPSVSV